MFNYDANSNSDFWFHGQVKLLDRPKERLNSLNGYTSSKLKRW